jgi:glyoxylase-like metal-dependent hydrolase (beta-lactamase superfamily II)
MTDIDDAVQEVPVDDDPSRFQPADPVEFEAYRTKALPPVREVRPGLWLIPVPFPGHPVRFTFAYAFVSGRDVVLVDPGWESVEGLESLEHGLGLAVGGAPRICGIVSTHYHPDHSGFAHDLVRATGAWFAMGPEPVHRVGAAVDDGLQRIWGVPDGHDGFTTEARLGAAIAKIPPADIVLGDRALIPDVGVDLRVVSTPGHTPGSVCLVVESLGVILTGDHVLPVISPHVMLERGGLADPTGAYLDSLDAMVPFRDLEALPGHEYRFHGLGARAVHLHQETVRRVDLVRAAAAGCRTVWEAAHHVDWRRGFDGLNGAAVLLAVAQTAAYVAHLRARGEALHIPVRPGD